MAVNFLYDAVIYIFFLKFNFFSQNLNFIEVSVGFRIDSDR